MIQLRLIKLAEGEGPQSGRRGPAAVSCRHQLGDDRVKVSFTSIDTFRTVYVRFHSLSHAADVGRHCSHRGRRERFNLRPA
jgi:hypothetical protein